LLIYAFGEVEVDEGEEARDNVAAIQRLVLDNEVQVLNFTVVVALVIKLDYSVELKELPRSL